MKNILLFFCIALISYRCNKEACCGICQSTLSACLEEKIEDFKTDPESIALYAIKVKGQCLYWFSTKAPTYDGTDDVLNSDCEIVCRVGGFGPPEPYYCLGGNLKKCTLDTLWHR